jgi:hypothetical protein
MKTLVFLILSLSLLSGAEPGFEGNQFSVSISGSDGKPVPDSQISLITNDGMIRQKGVAGADGLFTFEKPNKSSVLFAAAPYHESARLRYEGQGIRWTLWGLTIPTTRLGSIRGSGSLQPLMRSN